MTYKGYPWVMFSLIDWLSFGKGLRLKLDVEGQGDGRTLDVDGQEGGGS